ncbi:MAG: translation elongation factor Ts [Bacteroidales bacterium]|nr:translation elongation factor Ts [Bacteroidales bacterium]MCF8456070.1 translation elongation factor Ts [Bacteroidales bacterium]
MAEIKAADVAKLRKMTGAGMMDCKKALIEGDGDFGKAVEYIRERGQAIANKRADREASEGCVIAKASQDGKLCVLISLNCETDFVAKNEDFVKLAYAIADTALENNPANLDELKELQIDGIKIGDRVLEQTGIIGEKIELSYFDKIEAAAVVAYIHPGNKLATTVGFNLAGIDMQVYKDIAMQIAAMDPVSISKDEVPQDVRDEEFKIGREAARLEGKPEAMLDKIAEGRLNKFFKERTLLAQDFVKDNKMSVDQYLKSQNKELTVTAFRRFTLNV